MILTKIHTFNEEKLIKILFLAMLPVFILTCNKQGRFIHYTDSKQNNVSLHINEQGSSGRAIIFIHGNSFSHKIWSKQMDAPELNNYRLIFYDLRGHGKSSKFNNSDQAPDNYSLALHAEDLHKIIMEMKLKEPVVIGWSLGGNILLRYLIEYPESPVKKAIVLGATPSFGLEQQKYPDFPVSPPGEDLSFVIQEVIAKQTLTPDTARKYIRKSLNLNSENSNKDHREVLLLADIEKDILECDGNSRTGIIDGMPEVLNNINNKIPHTDADLRRNIWQSEIIAHIHEIKKPVRLFVSDHDLFPQEQILYMKKLNPHFSAIFFENEGHAPFFSNSEKFNKELITFVNESNIATH